MFKKDYNFGKQNEIQLLKQLQGFFKDTTIESLDNYNAFDFKGEKKYIELKSRHNTYDKYETTMIGCNKLDQARVYDDLGYEIFFVFNFIDGIYYWKYIKDNKLSKKRGGRSDRGRPEIKDYYYIPINYLQKLIV